MATRADEIKAIVKGYVSDHEEEFMGMKDDDMFDKVMYDLIEDAVWDGIMDAVDEFPPGPPDPYDEAKERLILAKHGYDI